MPKLGNSYPCMAPLTETTSTAGVTTVTVGAGKVIGTLADCSVSLNIAKAEFYADDGLDDSINEFISGTLSLTVNHLDYQTEASLSGSTAGTENESIVFKTDDSAPYYRYGYIETHYIGGVKRYKTLIYQRVQFSPINDSSQTKGQSANLTGIQINGTLSRDKATEEWKDAQWFDTLAAAKEYINTELNIT